MKITIEPSKPGLKYAPPTITVNSEHDFDSTGEAMDLLQSALIAFGHCQSAIDDWILERAEALYLVDDEKERYL